jgi:hypothetical protein
MPFDITKLRLTLSPIASVNGALYERVYRRYRPKWYVPFCRHGAFTLYDDDPFPTDPAEDHAIQYQDFADSGERFLLLTNKCLVCDQALLEGRLRKPNGSESSLGTLYVLAKDKFTPAPKDIPDAELRDFYVKEWDFIKTLLADFNKLTIAVAVAAAVFFDKYPSVFYAFIVMCFTMIALYIASYYGQRSISRQYYRAAGKTMVGTYRSWFDEASKYLQVVFAVAVIVVLCLMVRAERNMLNRPTGNDDLGKTRPYNPPTKSPSQAPGQQPQQTPVVTPPVKKD